MMAAQLYVIRDDHFKFSDEASFFRRTLNNLIIYTSSGGLYAVVNI